jgi:ADP-ribose pyrophosphatase
MKYRYQISSQETLSKGFLKLKRYSLRHDLFTGGESDTLLRERIEDFCAAAVLLFDPNQDKVVLIEQFRIGAADGQNNPWLLEIVGGLVEPGEDPAEVAKREALEEAGCEIQRLIPIGDFLVSPGFSTERVSLFCGLVDSTKAGGIHGLADEGEDIRVEVLPLEQALDELFVGRLNSTTGIVALQWLALNRDRFE